MDKITRLSAQERENLVADLDGVLGDAEAKVIEQMLAVSQVARHDVELLSRTWDLLNFLPRATVSGEFTQKTMSMAKLETAPPSLVAQWKETLVPTARRGAILTGWAGALVFAAIIGFRITRDWIPNDAELLAKDGPIIENLDAYTEVDSIEFLKELRRSGTFNDDSQPATPKN